MASAETKKGESSATGRIPRDSIGEEVQRMVAGTIAGGSATTGETHLGMDNLFIRLDIKSKLLAIVQMRFSSPVIHPLSPTHSAA